MEFRVAQTSDVASILKLHQKYQIDSILEEDKKDGFVTTPFTKEQLEDIILKEQGIFVAIDQGEVVCYVMSASWQYWSKWPMFAYMIENLNDLSYLDQTLTIDNSYQYGPVCVDKAYRGSGLLEQMFDFALEHMQKRYPILVTFVNKINPRSFEAHRRKLGLDVICEFSFNNNNYYEMVYDTSKRVLG